MMGDYFPAVCVPVTNGSERGTGYCLNAGELNHFAPPPADARGDFC